MTLINHGPEGGLLAQYLALMTSAELPVASCHRSPMSRRWQSDHCRRRCGQIAATAAIQTADRGLGKTRSVCRTEAARDEQNIQPSDGRRKEVPAAMTDNSEQTLILSAEEAARVLGISPGLAYELRSFSSCARHQLRHPAILRAKFGERFSVTAVASVGPGSRGERQPWNTTPMFDSLRRASWVSLGPSATAVRRTRPSVAVVGQDCQPSERSG